jgi:predicted dehydrogenase
MIDDHHMKTIGVGIIGSGHIALANHLPGLALCPEARVIALCDANPKTLEEASRATGVTRTYSDYQELLRDENVNAVIIATPNYLHAPIAIAACEAGKHVLCEKPIAMNLAEARQMLAAAQKADVRHMTAFTYRFVPAMRYMKHLVERGDVGRLYHFRARRFQDWGDRPLGWRQTKATAGTGELADMLSHRIDYAHHLAGPFKRLTADLRTFVPVRGGQPTDVDDWVAIIAEFERDESSGVLESTKLASGRGEGHRGEDDVEINGSEGSIVYSTQSPLTLRVGKRGDMEMHTIDVPQEFRTWPSSRRTADAGDPLVTFRYDQDAEFIDAIVNKRPCSPSFADGAKAQIVMDAAVQSHRERRWVDVNYQIEI